MTDNWKLEERVSNDPEYHGSC